MVVFIDELDRCRPSYAIELLETGKHIFAVNHVVFVIAVNRSELSHSVKVLYGNDFGADGYLRRFFDMDFRLPEPDRGNFIQQLLVSGGFYQYLERTGDQFVVRNRGLLLTVMQTFLGESEISLRECGQAIHRFGLVLSSLAENERAFCPHPGDTHDSSQRRSCSVPQNGRRTNDGRRDRGRIFLDSPAINPLGIQRRASSQRQ